MSEKRNVYCNFCGEDDSKRRTLIATALNDSHICDVCVFVCMTIIASPNDDRQAMLRDVKAFHSDPVTEPTGLEYRGG